MSARKVWNWHSDWDIPNASLYRDPWGFYLRTNHWRLLAGPLFGWGVQRCWAVPFAIRRPGLFLKWKWQAFKGRKTVTIYGREPDGEFTSTEIPRVPELHGKWWYSLDRQWEIRKESIKRGG